MTCGATFATRGGVLEHEGPTFVRMTSDALVLLEAAEQRPRRRLVWIVARRALEHAFTNTMVVVVLSFGELLAMAPEADPRGAASSRGTWQRRRLSQQRRRRVLA